MSNIIQIVEKLDKYVFDDAIPLQSLGFRIVEDVLRDDDFDSLAEKYPELVEITNGSDLEWQASEQMRSEIRKVFDKLKKRVLTEST